MRSVIVMPKHPGRILVTTIGTARVVRIYRKSYFAHHAIVIRVLLKSYCRTSQSEPGRTRFVVTPSDNPFRFGAYEVFSAMKDGSERAAGG